MRIVLNTFGAVQWGNGMEIHIRRGIVRQENVGGRNVHIYLPPSYGDQLKRYPVVYVHDPSDYIESVQSTVIVRLEELFAQGKIPELILVGVEPIERRHEYTPWPMKALEPEYPDFGGQGMEYLRFLVEELKPTIDASYLTQAESQYTGIIGASLGGLISLVASYEYGHIFGRIGMLSASLWYEGILEYMQRCKLTARDCRMYMYVGELEGAGKQTVQKYMVSNNQQAFKHLVTEGLAADRLKFVVGEGGRHELSAFETHFPLAMEWLYGKN